MPVVTTHYRVLVTAGRHRQPRNANSWSEPNSAEVGTHVANTPITPTPLGLLPYVENGENKLATFLFWSMTDHATVGETNANLHYTTTVGTNDTEITAWFLPPGGIGNGGPGYLVDTFSVMTGDFVSDTVFTVFDASNAENAALTTEANVVGIVDTPNQERLETLNILASTSEAFEHWITNAESGQAQPVVAGLDDTLAGATSGVAIATFRPTTFTVPKPSTPQSGWTILGGIAVDGGGIEWVIGHPGTGGPVGPWGPFAQRVVRAATVASQGQRFAAAGDLTKLALGEVLDATKQLQAQIERGSKL